MNHPASGSPFPTPRAWHNPVRVQFGPDLLTHLPAAVGDRTCYLVTFPEARATGLRDRLKALLGTRLLGIMDDVRPNPDLADLAERHQRFWRDHGEAQVVVAVGGGSVIDTAKALLARPARGRFADLLGDSPQVVASRPLIAVPTTAGTGSEVTPWATVWSHQGSGPEGAAKFSLHLPETWPEQALVDPLLSATAPPGVTLHSGLDALSHALESLWNVNANPVSDTLGIRAARQLLAHLPRLVADLADTGARLAVSRAALLAGLAFSNTQTALAHSLSYDLTLHHGLPHGLACSFTLPQVWRLALGHDGERDEVLSRVFDGASAAEGADRLQAFLANLDVATDFAAYGIDSGRARMLLERALQGKRGRNFIGASGAPERLARLAI